MTYEYISVNNENNHLINLTRELIRSCRCEIKLKQLKNNLRSYLAIKDLIDKKE